jgi:UDP-glucose 4-epimerase
VLVPMVHSDDVADAIVRVLDRRAAGPFNLAAEPVITVEHLAAALNAWHVQVPEPIVRAAGSLAWHARLEQVDPGWLDLAHHVPLLDSGRAERELGWRPQHDSVSVLEEVVAGMLSHASDESPPLRRRSVRDNLRQTLADGPVHLRTRP